MEEFERLIWTSIAFACRYGHQAMSEVLQSEDLMRFNYSLQRLLREEGDAGLHHMATGG